MYASNAIALNRSNSRRRGPWLFESEGPRLDLDGPDLIERLKLTADQIKQAKVIVEVGEAEIQKAAAFPIVIDPKAGEPTPESVQELVKSPEFNEAKKKAIESAHRAWALVVPRIEKVLTEPQRMAYHEMLGDSFELTRLQSIKDEAANDAIMVDRAVR